VGVVRTGGNEEEPPAIRKTAGTAAFAGRPRSLAVGKGDL
jgi:hypothetical protein